MNLNDLRMSLKSALDNMWTRIDARITAIEQGGGGGGVTGVKGDAEASYRHGNVNLTPANIGAVGTTNIIDVPHGGTGGNDTGRGEDELGNYPGEHRGGQHQRRD